VKAFIFLYLCQSSKLLPFLALYALRFLFAKQIKRNIYLWKKANIDEIKSDTIQLSNKITCDTNTSSKNNTDIEEIWNQLKQHPGISVNESSP
jgi:hypothetical protein